MLDRHAIALEDRKHAAQIADLVGHVVLEDVNRYKVPLARNARDDRLVGNEVLAVGDDRPGVERAVGVLHRDGNARLHDREYGLLVQDARAHVRKLAHLLVRDAADGLGMLDDARVGGEEAGDIGPVLIQIGIQALGKDRARDIAAAAIEQLDLSLARGAVEARHHETARNAPLLDERVRAGHG